LLNFMLNNANSTTFYIDPLLSGTAQGIHSWR